MDRAVHSLPLAASCLRHAMHGQDTIESDVGMLLAAEGLHNLRVVAHALVIIAKGLGAA